MAQANVNGALVVLLGAGALVGAFAIGAARRRKCSCASNTLTPGSVSTSSATPIALTLAAGAMSQSVPTGGQITISTPAGGSITTIAVQSTGSTTTPGTGIASETFSVSASDTLTITWKDSTGAAQTTTLTLTAT